MISINKIDCEITVYTWMQISVLCIAIFIYSIDARLISDANSKSNHLTKCNSANQTSSYALDGAPAAKCKYLHIMLLRMHLHKDSLAGILSTGQ